LQEAELSKSLHSTFIKSGFKKLPRGMTGVDSG
jgi:protein farnesyltransferase subunit beta